jgi:hypothetical protein
MRNHRSAHVTLGLLGVVVAACSGNPGSEVGGAGGAPVLPASPEARALVEKARALHLARPAVPAHQSSRRSDEAPARVLGAAILTTFARQGARLVPTVTDEAARGVRHRAEVWLAAAGAGFHVEDRDSRLAVDVRPADAEAGVAEVVEGYVVYRARRPGGPEVIHRVTAEGTEDFVWFERAPALAELSYELTLARGIAGLRSVAGALELLDAAGTPRLRMAPPYVVDATGQKHAAQIAVRGCAYDEDPRGPWGRAVTPPGAERCEVRVQWGEVPYPALVDPAWTATGSMATPRGGHTASVLADGKVLVAGSKGVASAELYDPATGTWSNTGSMAKARVNHTASVLAGGDVLVAGGDTVSPITAGAERYHPASGTWSGTGSMATARVSHTASVLADGQVLAAGGLDAGGAVLASAERYDPASGTWSNTGSLATARSDQTATVLGGGAVLVAGGFGAAGLPIAGAERYDPASGAWSNTGSLTTARGLHTASVLADGKVLVAAGDAHPATASAELYDPASGAWSDTGSLATARRSHTASVLADGKVLVVAGLDTGSLATASAELFDPSSATWSGAGTLTTTRAAHSASLLGDGRVLVAGSSAGVVSASAELFGRLPIGAACAGAGECASASCADGFCCDTACSGSCDVCAAALGAAADGTCTPAPAASAGSPSCGPYRCDGSSVSCPSSCAGDPACAANYQCVAGGTCQCLPDHQVDGFCCDTPCAGPCQACSQAAKGGVGADGICGATGAGLDPHDDCPDQGAASCGHDGACDGSGACRHYASGTACAPGECHDGGVTVHLCDGAGTCATTSHGCGPAVCAGGDCVGFCSADTDCVAGNFCDPKNEYQCLPLRPAGESCQEAAHCLSGFCADGYCCDQACGGACQSCDATPGTCAPLAGAASDGGDPSCSPDPGQGAASGCSCDLPGEAGRGRLPWGMLLAGLLGLRRWSPRRRAP